MLNHTATFKELDQSYKEHSTDSEDIIIDSCKHI